MDKNTEAKKVRKEKGKSNDVKTHALSSSERAVQGIIETFLAGRYVPGQKLIESELTSKYQLSRGPIREALKRLSAEGVVILKPHRGAFIRSFNRQEMREMMVILEVLVGLQARLAAEAIQHGSDPKPLEEAYQLLTPFGRAEYKELVYVEQRRNFYDALLKIGGNVQLPRITPSVEIHIIRAQINPFLTAKGREQRQKEYAQITKAVLEGTPKQAERAARKHILESQKRHDRLPDQAFA